MSLTPEQIDEQLTASCPWWSAAQWATFRSLSPDEQQAMATIAQDSDVSPGVDGWALALKVLETAATIVGDVTGLGSAVTVVKTMAKAL